MSSNSFDSSAIYVNLPKAKVCYIKNIKTSSKNLIAKNTHYYTTSSDDTYTDTFASIGLYAKKTGKYKVTYNICDKSGNKLSSGKVTVYVKMTCQSNLSNLQVKKLIMPLRAKNPANYLLK